MCRGQRRSQPAIELVLDFGLIVLPLVDEVGFAIRLNVAEAMQLCCYTDALYITATIFILRSNRCSSHTDRPPLMLLRLRTVPVGVSGIIETGAVGLKCIKTLVHEISG